MASASSATFEAAAPSTSASAATFEAAAPSTSSSPLDSFLAQAELSALAPALAGATLGSLTSTLFDEGRGPLLKMLQQRGVALKDRQALANALGRASRDGLEGVTEVEDGSRTSWLDGDGEARGDAAWARPSRRWLVFTSAGNVGNVTSWTRGGTPEFELVVVYYGDAESPPCLRDATHAARHKGGKFPNLLWAMKAQLAYFRCFEAVLVADDDVLLSADDINRLFQARHWWSPTSSTPWTRAASPPPSGPWCLSPRPRLRTRCRRAARLAWTMRSVPPLPCRCLATATATLPRR